MAQHRSSNDALYGSHTIALFERRERMPKRQPARTGRRSPGGAVRLVPGWLDRILNNTIKEIFHQGAKLGTLKISAKIGRPHIPEDVKRKVRQRVGFGCVFCGNMVFHYEHIINFSDGGDDSVENLTALCPNCHQEVTSGRISKEQVRKANMRPFCLREKNSPGYRFKLGNQFDIPVGPNIFFCYSPKMVVFSVCGHDVLTVELIGGVPFVSCRVPCPDGKEMLEIDQNVMSAHSQKMWDCKFKGSLFKAWNRYFSSVIEILCKNSRICINKFVFVDAGVCIAVTRNNTRLISKSSGGTTAGVIGGMRHCEFDMSSAKGNIAISFDRAANPSACLSIGYPAVPADRAEMWKVARELPEIGREQRRWEKGRKRHPVKPVSHDAV